MSFRSSVLKIPDHKSQYTIYGSPQLDQRIDNHMAKIRDSILPIFEKNDLRAIILGGGYGRGEGGVFISEGVESLYNDFDLQIAVHHIHHQKILTYQEKVRNVAHELSKQIGIDVDFGPLLTPLKIKNAPFYMMWYELKFGYQVIYGDKDVLDEMPDYNGDEISVLEGLKLLLNRGTGLILSRQRLQSDSFENDDNDFVTRNIYKAAMAVGDCILMMKHQYHYSYQERMSRFKTIIQDPMVQNSGIADSYLASMEYKFLPRNNIYQKSGLLNEWQKTVASFKKVYYQVFEHYCGQSISGLNDYLDLILHKDLDQTNFRDSLKNIYLNCRDHGCTQMNSWFVKYPRWRLFYVFPNLLFRQVDYPSGMIEKALGLESPANTELIEKKYLELWNRYN